MVQERVYSRIIFDTNNLKDTIRTIPREMCVWALNGTVARWSLCVNPFKPELNPLCYLLALLGAHHFLHVSRIRVKLLTLR